MTVLAKTWAEVSSLQNEEDPVDDELDLARDLVRLSITNNKDVSVATPSKELARISDVRFDDLLFATPTTLSLEVHAPLDLFLARSDLAIYSRIHAYLLGIRRAQIRLGGLWKYSSLRRTTPVPWGPPLSNRPAGQQRLKATREREKIRTVAMRIIWATASTALLVLSELTTYFQGEVINESWSHFRDWLAPIRPTSSGSSRPGTASSGLKYGNQFSLSRPTTQDGRVSYDDTRTPHDPETMTAAHRSYLASIIQSLLLTDVPFTTTLRAFLTQIDHFVALISRLAVIQQNLDLETDEGVVDSLANYARDEEIIWQELRESRVRVSNGITELISRLREIDDNRLGDDKRSHNIRRPNVMGSEPEILGGYRNTYIPRKPAGVDRLLMKLDFGSIGHEADSSSYQFGHGISE